MKRENKAQKIKSHLRFSKQNDKKNRLFAAFAV